MRVTFFCFAKRKSPKKRRPPVCDPGASLRGKPAAGRLRGAPWNSLRCIAASFRHPRRVSSRSTRAPTRVPPRNRPAAGAASRGGAAEQPTSIRAIALPGPGCAARGASPAMWGRAQRWPVWMFCSPGPSGCAEERRDWRIRARVCLSDAQRRELSETPPNPSTAGCPVASAQGTQTAGSPFFWVLFFGEAKKSTSPAGRLPASALNPGTWPHQHNNQTLQNQ